MKVAGVIVEYNPFHNGHYYHIQKTKEETHAEIIIAIMSGNFLQRGEPALVSKWTRTKMAIEGGADIVIELPYVFATQKATTFAFGAISLLDALFVDEVCFGSESGNITKFHTAISHLDENNKHYDKFLKETMKEGVSYPKAASIAFQRITGDATFLDLTQPNNILGFQYIKAINSINSKMKPVTIKRTGSHYHDETFNSEIASATSIRKALFSDNGSISEIKNVVPHTTLIHLQEYIKAYNVMHSWENYFDLLKYRLLTMSSNELGKIYEAEEGLENRVLDHIKKSGSFKELMSNIKTKRYTWTRLQRFCTHILTNTSKENMIENMEKPYFIRLLGMTTEGQQYIRNIKKDLSIPLVSNLSSFGHPQIKIDEKAVSTFASALKEPARSKMLKEEYSSPPLRYCRVNQKYL